MPGFVEDLTAGRGPLGFLQDDYQIVDKVQEAVEDQGAGGILGVTNASLAVARGVVSFIVGRRHDRVPHHLHAHGRAEHASSASAARCPST